MPFEKGNTEWKKRKKDGRDGFGLEYQKKRVLDQAFHTLKMSMTKEGKELTEKEKIDLARQIVLKEIGKNIDITSKGDKLEIMPIYNGISRYNSDKADIQTEEEDKSA